MIVLVFLFLTITPAQTKTIYVDASRPNDSATCLQAETRSTAKKTITAGAGCLAGGDTLMIVSGTYPEILNNVFPSGTGEGARTIIKSEVQYGAVIAPTSNPNQWIIRLLTRQYITFDGLVIDGGTLDHAYHIISYGPNNYISVINCEIKNGSDPGYPNSWGITTDVVDTGWYIAYNKIHHVGADATVTPGEDARQSYGIYYTAANGIIEYNEIYNNGGPGISNYNNTATPSDNNLIRNNRFYHNGEMGIQFAAGGSDNRLYNNVFYGNGTRNSGSPGIKVHGAGPTSTNNQVYYNTVYNQPGGCIHVGGASGAPVNTTVRNNICYANSGFGDTVYNGFGASGTVSSNNLTGGTDPDFVSAATADFRVQSTSPAIGLGTPIAGISTDITGAPRSGTTPTAGAYESATALSPVVGTFYIATTGASSVTDCAVPQVLATPAASWGVLCPCVAGGSTVVFRGGTHTGIIDSADCNVIGGANFTAPTLFRPHTGETAILRPNVAGGTIVSLADTQNHHIVFQGLEFDGNSVSKIGIALLGSSHHVRAQGNTFHDFTASAVHMQNGSAHEILNNTIDDMAGSSSPWYPINLDRVTGAQVSGNTITDWGEGCIASKDASASQTNTGNVIRANICFNGTGTEVGILVGSSTGESVYNNLVHHSPGGLRTAPGVANLKVYNNTFATNTGGSGYGIWLDADGTGIQITNNIVWANTTGIVTNGAGATQTTNLTASDPLFLDAASGNYRLQTSPPSPAIDAGTTLPEVSTDLRDTGRDVPYTIGAYEETAPPVQTLRGFPWGSTGVILQP